MLMSERNISLRPGMFAMSSGSGNSFTTTAPPFRNPQLTCSAVMGWKSSSTIIAKIASLV
jgi:hypothetical protein